MTYYKHVKREANSQVNWAEVGKKISDSLIQVRDEREKRKAKIDEESRRFGEKLANAPQGENPNFNSVVNSAARDTAELRRIHDNLLRSGMMKMRDYSVARQNITDGWENFSNLSKEYNAEYEEKMRMYAEGSLSGQSLYEMDLIEGFANFTEVKPYIDPMTLEFYLAHKSVNEDGSYGADIDMDKPLVTVNEMRERLRRKVLKYDVIGGLTPVVESLGEHIEVMRRAGILTEENILRRDLNPDDDEVVSTYRRAQEKALNSILTSPDVASSIMYDYIGQVEGKQVDYIYDEAEAKAAQERGDNHLLYLKRDEKSGNLFFEPTEEQRDILFNALRDQMDVMLDIKQTPEPIDFQTEREKEEQAKGFESQVKAISSIANLWGGTDEQVDAAGDSLMNMPTSRGPLSGQDRGEYGITFYWNEGKESEFFSYRDEVTKEVKSQEDFIEGVASFFGIENIEEALARSRYNPNAEFNSSYRFNKKINVATKPFDDQSVLIGGDIVLVRELLSEIDQDAQSNDVTFAVRSAFDGLPEETKRNLTTEVVSVLPEGDLFNKDDVLKIFIPSVMDHPVFIPKEDNPSFNADLEDVLRVIYDRAANEEKVVVETDLADYITEYDKHNSQRIRNLHSTPAAPQRTTETPPAPSDSTITNNALPPNPNGIGSRFPVQNNTN
jgi:hypothetical protein